MKNFPLLLALLLTTPLSGFAQQTAAPLQRTIPSVTRTVQIFSTLENELNDAVQQRNNGVIDKRLADDYELRTAAAPGRPTPRAEWIASALKQAPFASQVQQMAVHEYGNVMIVSFLWSLDVDAASPLAKNIFVVDTWKQVESDWKLATRYVAPADAQQKTVPGVDLSGINTKKKI
ncbi:nuclear transport factor 2 family protein [Collimonas pratensis]|uniref:DUF4440 domain-containing protein n=1 Tax=Collimonas pratensis TaxID=279113 RepID=A0ABM5ZEN2_9BURK|nr:nuclear transport factor 2 family protein [Collimonas pratensis]AMP17287.1 hypothetical protein CPter291_5074 [Collimonas pratensis]NKI71347.1 DUF4440 domain-containing protein [Collimonas pratensis]